MIRVFASIMAAGTLAASLSGCAATTETPTAPPAAQVTPNDQDSQATDVPRPDLATPPTATESTTPEAASEDTAEDTAEDPVPAPGAEPALDVLARLAVKGRAPMTGYSREAFGPAWLDANRNGCDERNDVLAHDLIDQTEKNCRILTGTLLDPYTAQQISYIYGDGTLVDIDHVVALGNAWVSGAWRWEIRERAALATDPMNLLAVDASANRQKGDSDAATWLPPNKTYRCAYVARQVAVKAKFGLSVTSAEKSAITHALMACPDLLVPPDSGSPLQVSNNITEPPTNTETTGSGATNTTYENCDAVRAAGAAPIHRGDPGYHTSLDGDRDGVACE